MLGVCIDTQKMHIHCLPYVHIIDVYVGIRLYLYVDIGVTGCGGLLLFSGLSSFGHVCTCICMCLYMMCVGFILLYGGSDYMPFM